jgi:hypothetical protein
LPATKGKENNVNRTWRRIDSPSRIREYQALWDDNADYLLGYLRLIDAKADERNTDCFTMDESRIVTMETPAAGGQRGKIYLLRKIR